MTTEMADRLTKLEAALMVYDVTLKMVLSLSTVPNYDFLRSQIDAARDAYLWAMGEESMIPSQFSSQTEPSHDN